MAAARVRRQGCVGRGTYRHCTPHNIESVGECVGEGKVREIKRGTMIRIILEMEDSEGERKNRSWRRNTIVEDRPGAMYSVKTRGRVAGNGRETI